jgi:hypothetical protein
VGKCVQAISAVLTQLVICVHVGLLASHHHGVTLHLRDLRIVLALLHEARFFWVLVLMLKVRMANARAGGAVVWPFPHQTALVINSG